MKANTKSPLFFQCKKGAETYTETAKNHHLPPKKNKHSKELFNKLTLLKTRRNY